METRKLPGQPAQPDKDRLVLLGYLTRPQGLKGGIRFLPQFDNPDDLENLKTDRLFLHADRSVGGLRPQTDAYTQVTLVEFADQQKFLVFYLENVEDLTAAEAYRQLEVYVYEDELWDLPDGQYYNFQLIGLEVFDTIKNAVVGTVKSMQPGMQDYLVVARETSEFLVPYVPDIVTAVDLKSKRITVTLPEGIDDL